MGLGKSVEKLDKYYERLDKGKAYKIKPSHVEKVLRKLQAKELMLLEEIDETSKDAKKKRLGRKLDVVREQQERARWLQEKIARLPGSKD